MLSHRQQVGRTSTLTHTRRRRRLDECGRGGSPCYRAHCTCTPLVPLHSTNREERVDGIADPARSPPPVAGQIFSQPASEPGSNKSSNESPPISISVAQIGSQRSLGPNRRADGRSQVGVGELATDGQPHAQLFAVRAPAGAVIQILCSVNKLGFANCKLRIASSAEPVDRLAGPPLTETNKRLSWRSRASCGSSELVRRESIIGGRSSGPHLRAIRQLVPARNPFGRKQSPRRTLSMLLSIQADHKSSERGSLIAF